MSQTPQPNENKALLRREIDEGWSHNDLDVFDELYASDVQIGTERTGDGTLVSVEGIKSVHAEWDNGFPDATTELNAIVAEDDVVLAWWTLRGTHEGTFRDIEPTGNSIEVEGFSYRRYAGGLVVEVKDSASMHDLLTQLGAEFST